MVRSLSIFVMLCVFTSAVSAQVRHAIAVVVPARVMASGLGDVLTNTINNIDIVPADGSVHIAMTQFDANNCCGLCASATRNAP